MEGLGPDGNGGLYMLDQNGDLWDDANGMAFDPNPTFDPLNPSSPEFLNSTVTLFRDNIQSFNYDKTGMIVTVPTQGVFQQVTDFVGNLAEDIGALVEYAVTLIVSAGAFVGTGGDLSVAESVYNFGHTVGTDWFGAQYSQRVEAGAVFVATTAAYLVTGPIGGALVGAAGNAAESAATTGHVNWESVAEGAVGGAVGAAVGVTVGPGLAGALASAGANSIVSEGLYSYVHHSAFDVAPVVEGVGLAAAEYYTVGQPNSPNAPSDQELANWLYGPSGQAPYPNLLGAPSNPSYPSLVGVTPLVEGVGQPGAGYSLASELANDLFSPEASLGSSGTTLGLGLRRTRLGRPLQLL